MLPYGHGERMPRTWDTTSTTRVPRPAGWLRSHPSRPRATIDAALRTAVIRSGSGSGFAPTPFLRSRRWPPRLVTARTRDGSVSSRARSPRLLRLPCGPRPAGLSRHESRTGPADRRCPWSSPQRRTSFVLPVKPSHKSAGPISRSRLCPEDREFLTSDHGVSGTPHGAAGTSFRGVEC